MEVANIVAVAKMKEPFDLCVLSSKLDKTELNSSKIWLKMRLEPKNNYIAFYASGKFLVTGVKTFKELNNVVERVMGKLNDSNINVELEEIKVSNIVLTDKIELTNSLESLITSLDSSYASYEPETFPGLFYKDQEGISYTLFSNGKIIITGVKDIEVAKINLKKFKKIVEDID